MAVPIATIYILSGLHSFRAPLQQHVLIINDTVCYLLVEQVVELRCGFSTKGHVLKTLFTVCGSERKGNIYEKGFGGK